MNNTVANLRSWYLTVGLYCLMGTGSALYADAQPVTWDGPGILMNVLVPDVSSELSFKCQSDVLRPLQSEPPMASSTNKLECVSVDPDGQISRKWLFGEESTVGFWGNRFDRKPNFQVKGPFAKYLFAKLGWAYSENRFPGLITKTSACGPGGVLCTDIFALERDTSGENAAALLCSADSENGEVYSITCVFLH